jgi:hypothetical protein
MRKRTPAEPFLVQPQREWQEARTRLDEQVKRVAKLLLNNTQLEMNGTELPHKFKSLGIGGRNNFVAAIMMVNAEVHKRLSKERADASTEQLRDARESLDDILQRLVRRVKKAEAEYEEET